MGQSPASSRGGGGVTVLSYVEFTSDVAITATTAATANTVVTAAAVTVDGSTLILVEFSSPALDSITAGQSLLIVNLWQGSTDTGIIAQSSNARTPGLARRFLTPTAGTYTYSVRAYRGSANNTVRAGTGGVDTNMPGYIRVTSGA